MKGDLLKVLHRDARMEFLRLDFPKETVTIKAKERTLQEKGETKQPTKSMLRSKEKEKEKTKGMQNIASFFTN